MSKCDDSVKYRMLSEAARPALAPRASNALVLAIAFVTASSLVILGSSVMILLRAPVDGNQPLRKSAARAAAYAQMQKYNSHLGPLNIPTVVKTDEKEKVVSCYYDTPSGASGQLLPGDVHPFLCTHINVAFARVQDKAIHLADDQYKTITEMVQLKKNNPNLKILLSVGGAENDNGFPEMVADHASRKVFIKSIKSILRNYTLDGIDLDWEFPAMKALGDGLGKRERQHFSQLLREIRAEYIREKRDYLLTVAVAAPETIVDISYDVDQLNLYVDYVNVMSYDYHSYTKYTPFTGLNAPLFGRPSEQMFLATLNINYTVHMYMSKGLDLDKIVVGIPTYGHTFTLVNPANTRVGSPASSYGALGGLGFVNYPDICTFIKKYENDVTIEQDEDAKVPYLHREHEWVSFDTPQSVLAKAQYIKRRGLRGAMVYSLNADDYSGVCALGAARRFPLLRSVTDVLLNNVSSGEESER